jgi:RimJ/RimL family protein N-acetyltransferase
VSRPARDRLARRATGRDTSLVLTGPLVHLRHLRLDDAPRILELLRDHEVSRYFLWEPPHELAEAQEYVRGFQHEVDLRWAYHFAVVPSAGNELLGVANLYHIDRQAREAEIGIWLGRAYWGQGVQQEVNRLLLQLGFETLQLRRILFNVAMGNTRAQAAFRKLDVTERGRVMLPSQRQDQRVEHLVYGLEAAQWRETSGQSSAISERMGRHS